MAGGCMGQDAKSPQDQEVLWQASTINALLDGAYDGQVSMARLKESGNLGIGTFEALDGEMIVLDGSVYKARYDGTVEKVDDLQTTPFASVTVFNEDERVDDASFATYDALKKTLDAMIKNPNLFYAFKISGDFSYVKVRSVPPQQKPYPPLAEVTKNQPTFEYQNVKGHLVGFWCPSYVNGINVPGYHLHFISEDKTMGGHLLEVNIKNATIMADQTPSFQMTLPEDDGFANLKLEEDKTEELEKVEK
jgi:acetolactate decarboxylase